MKVIVGIGVPGCGKTTRLKPLASELGLAYVNADDTRQELTGDASDHSKEMAVWQLAHQRIKDGLAANGVIVDATYTKRKDRRELIGFCKANGAKEVIGYWFNLPLETCLERNTKRRRIVPSDAVRKMYNRLLVNPPTLGEGFSEIIEIKS